MYHKMTVDNNVTHPSETAWSVHISAHTYPVFDSVSQHSSRRIRRNQRDKNTTGGISLTGPASLCTNPASHYIILSLRLLLIVAPSPDTRTLLQ